MKLAKTLQYYENAGKQSKDLLEMVEEAYGFKLSLQHYEYFHEYGFIMFLGAEFYGIYENVFEGIYAGNAIVATLQGVKGDGSFCLGFGSRVKQNRPLRLFLRLFCNDFLILILVAQDNFMQCLSMSFVFPDAVNHSSYLMKLRDSKEYKRHEP